MVVEGIHRGLELAHGLGEVAAYRCWSGSDHFVSNNPGCEGTTTEGPLGWIYN
jgi:hypothetical protein